MSTPAAQPAAFSARSILKTALKVLLTAGAFYLLLTHKVRTESGETVIALRAILDYLPHIAAGPFWRFTALSFLVHFCPAAMYYFTALAIGAAQANFWEVSLASTIQIFATVMSPFTIAGEGAREIVQTLLLAHKIGTSQSIISAALGFWAAEAPTLSSGSFYFLRTADYRPRVAVAPRRRQPFTGRTR